MDLSWHRFVVWDCQVATNSDVQKKKGFCWECGAAKFVGTRFDQTVWTLLNLAVAVDAEVTEAGLHVVAGFTKDG